MTIDLTRSPDEIKSKFYNLQSLNDLAELLEINSFYLVQILYKSPIHQRYTRFTIPKKNGTQRTIDKPNPRLWVIQHKLKQVLEHIYVPRGSTYAYIKGRSIKDAADAHRLPNNTTRSTKRRKRSTLKYVLNVDLEDFFPSINFGRVRGIFESKPYNLPRSVSNVLGHICCLKNEGLPQGAPTSPIISNIICNKLDSQLQRLAQRKKCTYTRYADDIVFSTSLSRFPRNLAEKTEDSLIIGEELCEIIKQNGFKINYEKLRLQEPTTRQEITGLVVNKFPNVRRKYIRQVRAMLYDWKKNGYDSASKTHFKIRQTKKHRKNRFPNKPDLSFRDIVRGKIEYIGMIRGHDDAVYRRYLKQLAALDPSVEYEEDTMASNPATLFLSYAKEDEADIRELYNRLQAHGYKPWMSAVDLIGGENWNYAIKKALDKADFFIPCLTENSTNKRGYIQRELKQALDNFEGKLLGDIYVIPLRFNRVDRPEILQHFQHIDYFKPNGWNRLIQSIEEGIRRSKT